MYWYLKFTSTKLKFNAFFIGKFDKKIKNNTKNLPIINNYQ